MHGFAYEFWGSNWLSLQVFPGYKFPNTSAANHSSQPLTHVLSSGACNESLSPPSPTGLSSKRNLKHPCSLRRPYVLNITWFLVGGSFWMLLRDKTSPPFRLPENTGKSHFCSPTVTVEHDRCAKMRTWSISKWLEIHTQRDVCTIRAQSLSWWHRSHHHHHHHHHHHCFHHHHHHHHHHHNPPSSTWSCLKVWGSNKEALLAPFPCGLSWWRSFLASANDPGDLEWSPNLNYLVIQGFPYCATGSRCWACVHWATVVSQWHLRIPLLNHHAPISIFISLRLNVGASLQWPKSHHFCSTSTVNMWGIYCTKSLKQHANSMFIQQPLLVAKTAHVAETAEARNHAGT